MTHFPCRAAKTFFVSALSALLLSGAASASQAYLSKDDELSGAFLVPVEEFVVADGAFVVPEDEFVVPEEGFFMDSFVDPAAYMEEEELEGDFIMSDEDAFLVPIEEFVVPDDFVDPAAYMDTVTPTAGDMGFDQLAIGVGQTTGSALHMRSEPSTDSGVVMNLNKNVTLAILDDSRTDWYKVSYNGNVGYVSATYFRKVANTDFETYARVKGEGVYVRETPSDDANVLNVIDNEAVVTVNGLENGWYHVTCKYGTVGYIRSSSLDLISTSSSAQSGKADSIIATAMRYRGVRYVYGGTTPRGFDCSGFTKYVFAQNGITLPRTASTQWASGLGTRVYSRSALQKGDLVFFNDPRRNAGKSCSHVGIYIGDGQFIHASSGGSGVTVSNLSATYYRTYFKGGLHFNW